MELKIIIDNINISPDEEASDCCGYFDIEYTVINNGKIKKGFYSTDYEDWEKDDLLEFLKEGWAEKLVLEQELERL